MDAPQGSAAPASGTSEPEILSFAELAADPGIAALLGFEAAPRKVERPDGWTADRQRELIARIAATGSPGRAVDQMDKNLSGAKHLYRTEGADSFRAAWKAALALAAARQRAERAAAPPRPVAVPGIAPPGTAAAHDDDAPLPGQVRNEYGEWEDQHSIDARVDDARHSICNKLLNARRLYLAEIGSCPGKRAAFEILTEYEVDWDKAARLERQDDEPWRRPNMREPDMVLTAESGWLMGEIGYGPDRKAELRRAIDDYRAEEGLEPVDWDADGTQPPSPLAGEGRGEGAPL